MLEAKETEIIKDINSLLNLINEFNSVLISDKSVKKKGYIRFLFLGHKTKGLEIYYATKELVDLCVDKGIITYNKIYYTQTRYTNSWSFNKRK